MAATDAQSLLTAANCLRCFAASPTQLDLMELALLQQIQQNGISPPSPPVPPFYPSLYYQDFESGLEPSGWTVSGSAPVWNYHPALLGNYSLGLGYGTYSYAAYALSPTQATLYAFFWFRTNQLPSAQLNVVGFSTPAAFLLYLNSDGTLRIVESGGSSASTVGSIAINTTYKIWLRYSINTGGNNGVGSVAFSTSYPEPTSGNNFASYSGASGNTNAPAVRFLNPSSTVFSAGAQFVFDHFGLDTTDSMGNGWGGN